MRVDAQAPREDLTRKKLVICLDVTDSELEDICLAVSSLGVITDLKTCATFAFCRRATVKARYATPTRLYGIHHLTRCFHIMTFNYHEF